MYKKSLKISNTMRVINVFVGNTNVAIYSDKISRLPFSGVYEASESIIRLWTATWLVVILHNRHRAFSRYVTSDQIEVEIGCR